MKLIGVLSNPKSTRNSASMHPVREVVEGSSGIFHYEIGGIEDVPLALRQFADYGVELVVINGGDGTIQAAFSTLLNDQPFKVMPPVVILPAGKTNMIAMDLGARRPKPAEYLRQLLEWRRDGRIRQQLVRRHVLKIEGIDRARPIYGMFLGTAGIVAGIEYCRRWVYPLGLPNFLSHPLAVAALICRTLWRGAVQRAPEPDELLQISVDGKGKVMGRYFIVIASTLDRLIMGFRPFTDSGAGGVRFFAAEDTPSIILRALALVIRGKLKDRHVAGVTVRNAQMVRMRLSAPVTVDGELYTLPPGREVTVSADHALTFLSFAPQSAAAS